MYKMNSNIFSIDPNVVVSEKNFTRLNNWLRSVDMVGEFLQSRRNAAC
jgi:hypothetical protein